MDLSLGKTLSPTVSILQLPVVLCVGSRPPELPHPTPIHFDLSTVIVLVKLKFRGSHWSVFGVVASDIAGRHHLTVNCLFLWFSQSLVLFLNSVSYIA